ncbi:MAG: hypothetical protein H7A47_01690 [Verrucomicrobiales bacterium]|nr:hypothetical protein [Verrucomicrobiales bacterium]
MQVPLSNGGHSARVRMRLHVSGASFPISQMGPDFLLVEAPCEHPPGRGRIELQVDDSHRTWEVDLPEGVKADREEVPVRAVA